MVGKTRTTWDSMKCPYYHFTSLESFFKIFNTKKIRLSACNDMKNVGVETMALYAALKKIIENCKKIKKVLLEKYSCNETNDLINKIIIEREHSYMACFSKFKDENEISEAKYMWKFYADNNKGVVIKFNYEYFLLKNKRAQGMLDESGDLHRFSNFRMEEITYEEERLKKILAWPKDTHWVITDIYKPKYCDLENELRLMVFLRNREDLYTLKGISEVETENTDRPNFLYYDLNAAKGDNTAPVIGLQSRSMHYRHSSLVTD